MKVVNCTDHEIEQQIDKLLLRYGVNKEMKGYKYMKDIILLGYTKKYSSPVLKDYFEEVANRYNIKAHSVQRQLRYAVTKTNIYGAKVTPEELLQRARAEIKTTKTIIESDDLEFPNIE